MLDKVSFVHSLYLTFIGKMVMKKNHLHYRFNYTGVTYQNKIHHLINAVHSSVKKNN